jgi:hypothetical protein
MDEAMKKRLYKDSKRDLKTWSLDQFTKSEFFHQKLHEWGLLTIAAKIEKTKGETFDWDLNSLGISEEAWKKVIHRGIKPVIVFASPVTLRRIPGSVGYYRMLSMVSQKSMNRVGLSASRYESGKTFPDDETSLAIAKHLNAIISRIIELDKQINAREFDLWRGMAAGSQAQGSWQNTKGDIVDVIIKGILQRRLREEGLVVEEKEGGSKMQLKDGRTVIFADEPDVALYQYNEVQAAVEIKGGIDPAGVLERIGAAFKSLLRVREENPRSTTILILQGVSLTQKAKHDLEINRHVVTDWFTVEDVLENKRKREQIFRLLRI